MTHEMVVALHVTDEALYQQYRAAMTPLLTSHGGGFRYDFTVANVLKSASEHPINRVFAIYFGSLGQKEAFFAHPEYAAIKARWFAPSVGGITVLGSYDR